MFPKISALSTWTVWANTWKAPLCGQWVMTTLIYLLLVEINVWFSFYSCITHISVHFVSACFPVVERCRSFRFDLGLSSTWLCITQITEVRIHSLHRCTLLVCLNKCKISLRHILVWSDGDRSFRTNSLPVGVYLSVLIHCANSCKKLTKAQFSWFLIIIRPSKLIDSVKLLSLVRSATKLYTLTTAYY